MKRHYYISDDLDDLEVVERDLEESGVTTPQIHVLSENDAGVETHHLHAVESVFKKDVVYSAEIGFVIGLVVSAIILIVSYYSDITDTISWVPPVFLSIIILGFCTWEGGLFGIQNPHHDFRRFQDDLHQGKHVMFVDVDPNQEETLSRVIKDHPKMQLAGVGSATPGWIIKFQQIFSRFIRWAP